MPYTEVRDQIQLASSAGYVTVIVNTTIPQHVNFGLVLEDANGSHGPPNPASGQLAHSYLVGSAAMVRGKFLVCYGRIVDPAHGKFEVHCDFYQNGAFLGRSKSAAGQLTQNSEDFGILCEFV